MRKILLFLLVVILFLPLVSAVNLSEYDIDVFLYEKQSVVDSTLVFQQAQTGVLKLNLPGDAKGISVYADGVLLPGDWSSELMVSLDNVSVFRYSYVTSVLLDSRNFLFNRDIPHNMDLFTLRVTLDKGLSIEKNKEGNALAVFPKPDLISSDGELIFLEWQMENVPENESVAVFAKLKKDVRYSIWPLILILVVLLYLLFLALRKKHKVVYVGPRPVKNVVEKQTPQTKTKDDSYLDHLKEDEEQVVNVLKLKEGSCEQGTLVIATGFSKATLSRLLMELEERKIIYKEKRGKKNIIHLKKGV